MKKIILLNLIMIAMSTAGVHDCAAGIVDKYRGIEWMISEADHIVIANKAPVSPSFRPDGTPMISHLPDITGDGIEEKMIIKKVLKGGLTTGSTATVFLPITSYFGDHPVEFPMASAGKMGDAGPMIMFINRMGKSNSLETLRCFGSTILADAEKVKDFEVKPTLRQTILDVIEKEPGRTYHPEMNGLFIFDYQTTGSQELR